MRQETDKISKLENERIIRTEIFPTIVGILTERICRT